MEFNSFAHKYTVVSVKGDFTILNCSQCRQYLIVAANAILDVNHSELADLKNSLIKTLEGNSSDPNIKYLISVSGFKKIQLCLSVIELNTLIDLIKETLIILEAQNILSNLASEL